MIGRGDALVAVWKASDVALDVVLEGSDAAVVVFDASSNAVDVVLEGVHPPHLFRVGKRDTPSHPRSCPASVDGMDSGPP